MGKLEKYLKDYKSARTYVENSYHDTWDDAWKLYNNKRVDYGYDSNESDMFIPETFTIIESLVANIAGGRPSFDFVPINEEQESNTKVLNQMMDYFWDANGMDLKAQQWVREMLMYGTGVLHVGWDGDKPTVENIPAKDFFVDPTATNLENANYVGFRYLTTKKALKDAMIYDPEEQKMVPKYKNTNRLQTGRISNEQTDKEDKDEIIGSTLSKDAQKSQVEVVVIYYRDGMVAEFNKNTVIRETDTPYQRGPRTKKVEVMVDGEITQTDKDIPKVDPFYPFAVLRDYIDPSLFYGRGEVQVIAGLQENLNDLENQDNDNISYTNNVMWQVDPQFEDMVPEIESTPGAVYAIPRGALAPIERPTLTQDLDAKKFERKEEMRRATAADEIIQGVSQDQGRVTATEVQAQINQANQRFSTKVSNLESEGFAQLGRVFLRMVQIFIDETISVRILGPEGVTFEDFDPAFFAGEYEPHVKLETTVEQVKLEEGQKLNQMYQIILGNPAVNQTEAVRFILKNMGAEDEDVNRMLTLEQPAPAGDPLDALLNVPQEGIGVG